MWIHSIELRTSKKISKDAEVPLGWQRGRVINFDKIDIAKKKEVDKIKKHEEYLIRVRDIMHYYRDNDISMRELSKKFNVGHNVYKTFEKYYPEEYKAIVSKKRGNSNVTKGRYLES